MSRLKPLKKKEIVLIERASGEKEPFDKEKLKRSLLNAGAENKLINEIISNIEEWIYDGITTKKIYSRAFSILRKRKTIAALKYRIKQAMLELGPTGYPFENFIGEVFKKQGFEILVGAETEGKCITHEVDVVATNKKIQHIIECKYSKDQGRQINIQVPLYVRSRVNDIIHKRKRAPEYKGFSFFCCFVWITRFSRYSIQFSKCCGLKLLGWDYPLGI